MDTSTLKPFFVISSLGHLVEKLVKNLISVSKLTDEKYSVYFDNKHVKITDLITGKEIVGIRKGNLYYLYPCSIEELKSKKKRYLRILGKPLKITHTVLLCTPENPAKRPTERLAKERDINEIIR